MRRPPHRLLSFKETLARKTAPQVFTLYDSKKRTGVMGYVILLTVLVIGADILRRTIVCSRKYRA